MCTECEGLREIVAHIEQAAEILEGRVSLFNSRFSEELPQRVAEAYAEVFRDCGRLVRAVYLLRPLVAKDKNPPHQV